MPTCEKCGARLADDASECQDCGAQIAGSSDASQDDAGPPPIPQQAAPLVPPPLPPPDLVRQDQSQIATTAAPSSAQSFWNQLSPPVQVGLMISPATLVLEILNAMTGCLAMLITKPLMLALFVYQGVLLAKRLAAQPVQPGESLFRLGATSALVAQALPAIWWTALAVAATGATFGVALVALPLVLAAMALTIGANVLITGYMTKRQYTKMSVQ